MVHLGANACIVGRNTEKTCQMAKEISTARTGSRVLGLGGVDVRNMDSLRAAVHTTVHELGRIDFLIVGAAGNFLASLDELSSNAFSRIVEIGLIGAHNAIKACMPHLLEAVKRNAAGTNSYPSGRIVFMSGSGYYTGIPLQAHMSSTKAGLDALAASVAIEYGPQGITSNVISPGPIQGTEGVARLSGEAYRGSEPWRKIPCGRYGSVKDVADATVFLFSDAANYIQGAIIVVDGGAWRTGASISNKFRYPDDLFKAQPGRKALGMSKI